MLALAAEPRKLVNDPVQSLSVSEHIKPLETEKKKILNLQLNCTNC